jgi:biopolymer transport protein ExbD
MARKPQDNPQLDMTPMIDVVFELIIFFVVTIQQQDIFSRLNVNRPAPANSSSSSSSDDITCNIEIGKDPMPGPRQRRDGVIVYNRRQVSINELDGFLKDTAAVSTDTPIIVKCTTDSPHKTLVDVLDRCYKYKLYSVSVFTL